MTPLVLPFAITAATAVIGILLIGFLYGPRREGKSDFLPLAAKAFIVGAIAMVPAAAIEALIAPRIALIPPRFGGLVTAFIQVSLVEEGIKLLAIRLLVFRDGSMRTFRAACASSVILGLAFATLESVAFMGLGIAAPLVRAATAVPLHIATAGILGYAIGRSRFSPPSSSAKAFAAAFLLHGFYDYILALNGPIAYASLAVLSIALVTLHQLYKKI
jgi:protease PrsW